MTITYQVTLCIIGIVGALSILFCLRRNALHTQQAVWWVAAAVCLVFAGLFPKALDAIGHFLGVTYPPTLFLTLGFVVLLLRLLWADMERCRMIIQIRLLTRHQAELALRLAEFERSCNVQKNSESSANALSGTAHEVDARHE